MSKIILISGANGNLGTAVTDYFLNKDYTVIGLVHHKKGIEKSNFEEIEVDLTDERATENVIQSLLKKYKKIDVTILTTGGFAIGNLFKTGQKELQKQYALNFETAYFVTRSLLSNQPKDQKSKIFFIGSEPGMDTSKGKGVIAYALAKSQLFQLAKILNADTNKFGMQAHVIVPSTIDTPQNRKSAPDADFSTWQKPEDIAAIIGRYATDFSLNKEVLVVEELLNF